MKFILLLFTYFAVICVYGAPTKLEKFRTCVKKGVAKFVDSACSFMDKIQRDGTGQTMFDAIKGFNDGVDGYEDNDEGLVLGTEVRESRIAKTFSVRIETKTKMFVKGTLTVKTCYTVRPMTDAEEDYIREMEIEEYRQTIKSKYMTPAEMRDLRDKLAPPYCEEEKVEDELA